MVAGLVLSEEGSSSPVAGVKTPLERLFQLMGTVGDLDFERRIAAPRDGAAGIKAQEPVNPLQVILAAATAEVGVERDPMDPESPFRGMRLNVAHRAALAGHGTRH